MYLELDHLKKHFDGREVVRDLSLTLEQGQLLCILCLLYTSDAADE